MSTTPCYICAGLPSAQVVWLADLTRAERRQRAQWYAQRWAQCGEALVVHQTWRHPHGLVSAPTHCVAFRQGEGGLAVEATP